MHVAIAIVGFRNTVDIVRCLGALEASSHTDFEVIICENGGPAAYAALVAAVSRALAGDQRVELILAPGNLGYAGGVNVCLKATPNADAWWVLNPDTVAEPGALAALVARLAAGGCDAVGGVLYGEDGRVQSYGGRWQAWWARAVSIGYGASLGDSVDAARVERRQNYISGASMLVGRRFVDVVGPLREEYFLYCEEVEWCLRGLKRGMRLGFAPGSRVLHLGGTTTGLRAAVTGESRLVLHLKARNQILLTWDCFPVRAPVVAIGALLAMLLRYGRRGAWREGGLALEGWWAGVRGRRGAPSWLAA
jgi:N-acetylglucosaminyl-diphospho-decaprenol L-rhamnosyltransferase